MRVDAMEQGDGLGISRSPRSATFTTLAWDGHRRVRSPQLHMKRLREHMDKLGMEWPDDFGEQLRAALDTLSHEGTTTSQDENTAEVGQSQQPPALLRVEVDGNGVVGLVGRPCLRTASEVGGICHPAPRYSADLQGLKHADWQAYTEAGIAARESGADVALLVHDEAVIDADRATPILLDGDGIAWISDPILGGVNSTTIEFLLPTLEKAGIPLQHGRLTAAMFAKAREVVLVGSGVVAVRLNSLDGEKIGNGDSILQPLFLQAIDETGWASFEHWIEVVG